MSEAPHIIVFPDPAAVAEAAARRLIERVGGVPTASVCLTGGSSPKTLYELLATPAWRGRVPWAQTHWFLGDERAVPADDPLNNGAMARHAFLDACAAPATVHMIATTSPPDRAARRYQTELEDFKRQHRADRPLFDLVLLGVGPDGHVASLFPGMPGPGISDRLVVGVERANVEPFVPRISLTLPCLADTREMLFLATGAAKRDILRRVFAGEDLPAALAQAAHGDTVWLIDRAADPRIAR